MKDKNIPSQSMDAFAPIRNHPIIGKRVEVQLFTTLQCNLKCTYCSLSEGEVRGSLDKVEYSLDALDAFIAKYLANHEIYITFYGGEPTLNTDFIEEIMRRYPAYRYQMQTNGTRLNCLSDFVSANLSNVLVSVDGGQEVTDQYRGKGVYERIFKNVEIFRGRVGGSLTARMTWADPDTSLDDFDKLLTHFDWIYWQFAHFQGVYSSDDIEKKKKTLARLIEKFFSSDALYPLIPVMGMVKNKVLPSRAIELYSGATQCRVSTHILNILSDGRVYACPDMAHIPEMLQGNIIENWLKPSPLQYHPKMPCTSCPAYIFCRSNCMKNLYRAYVQDDKKYREEVVEPICDLILFMGNEIDKHNPANWYARAPLSVKKDIRDCEVYEYVEVMP